MSRITTATRTGVAIPAIRYRAQAVESDGSKRAGKSPVRCRLLGLFLRYVITKRILVVGTGYSIQNRDSSLVLWSMHTERSACGMACMEGWMCGRSQRWSRRSSCGCGDGTSLSAVLAGVEDAGRQAGNRRIYREKRFCGRRVRSRIWTDVGVVNEVPTSLLCALCRNPALPSHQRIVLIQHVMSEVNILTRQRGLHSALSFCRQH